MDFLIVTDYEKETSRHPNEFSVIPNHINTYFQAIDTNNAYCAPRLSMIPEEFSVPTDTVDEYSVLNVSPKAYNVWSSWISLLVSGLCSSFSNRNYKDL